LELHLAWLCRAQDSAAAAKTVSPSCTGLLFRRARIQYVSLTASFLCIFCIGYRSERAYKMGITNTQLELLYGILRRNPRWISYSVTRWSPVLKAVQSYACGNHSGIHPPAGQMLFFFSVSVAVSHMCLSRPCFTNSNFIICKTTLQVPSVIRYKYRLRFASVGARRR